MDFKTLVETCTQGICIIKDTSIVYANPAFSKMFDYSSEEILQKHIKELISSMSDLVPEKKDVIGVSKVGDKKHFRCNIQQIHWDGGDAIQMSIRDITAEIAKELEHASMMATVTDNVKIGLWQANELGNVTYANKHFCDIFEYDSSEIIGKALTDLVRETDITTHLSHSKELEIIMGDGVTKWVKITCNRIINGYVGTVSDISTSKLYLPELIKLREDIKQEKIR